MAGYCLNVSFKHFMALSDTGKVFHNIGDATVKQLSPCVTVSMSAQSSVLSMSLTITITRAYI